MLPHGGLTKHARGGYNGKERFPQEREIAGGKAGWRRMRCSFYPNGDRAVSVVFPEEISQEVHRQVLALCRAIESAPKEGLLGCVPSYRALLVEYDPLLLGYEEAVALISAVSPGEQDAPPVRTVRLPVCYGDEFGPDIGEVAAHAGLTAEEVIKRHAGGQYLVYMLGFRPGFPYLGGMTPQLATPRKKSPRLSIAAGSVGIAGMQTGVYPEASPGGWNIIGRTSVTLFSEQSGALLRPGDMLRFIPIGREEYERLLKDGGWQI